MNASNDQNLFQMPEYEIKSHKKIFSYLSFSILVYILLVNVLAVVAALLLQKVDLQALDLGAFNFLLKPGNFNLLFNAVIQYLIAFPVLCLVVLKIPAHKPVPQRTDKSTFVKYMLIGIFIMYVGNIISTNVLTLIELIMGNSTENPVSTMMESSDWYINLLIVGIIGPIVEELIFRKLLIDRLSPFGDAVAILFPSLIFALIHGNFYQLFYAFALGAVFSYIYLKTGKIIYSTILHVFINVFCGVIPSLILSMPGFDAIFGLLENPTVNIEVIVNILTEAFLPLVIFMLYESIMIGMQIAGLILFIINVRKIRLNKGSVRLPKGRTADIIFFNAGSIALIIVCVILIAINTIPMA